MNTLRRYSKKREKIISILQKSENALSAKAIHELLPEIDLTTIYRNLEKFVTDGEVKKLNLGGSEILYEFQAESHHHAVCNVCEKVIHFKAPDSKIKQLLGLEDFEIDELEVVVRGVCRHDKNKKK